MILKNTSLNARSTKLKISRGFSLIELLVVMGIFIIITSVVLARQNKFSSDILLTDLAYQVAISIRQAQVYGLGVRGAGSNFNTGYGVHFDNTSLTTYKFFNDANKDGIGDSSEISATSSTTFQLEKGEKIGAVCGIGSSGTSCIGQGINNINIIYIRPDPSANITSELSSAISDGNNSYILPPNNSFSSAVITIVSGLGDRYKCVTVYQTGQVSVSNPTGTSTNPCL